MTGFHSRLTSKLTSPSAIRSSIPPCIHHNSLRCHILKTRQFPSSLFSLCSALSSSCDNILYSIPNIVPAGVLDTQIAVNIPRGFMGIDVGRMDVALAPQAIYDGGYKDAKDLRLKIANGGAGQSGLIKAWADAFIQYCVKTLGYKPFRVRWNTVMTLMCDVDAILDWVVSWRHYGKPRSPSGRLHRYRSNIQRGGGKPVC